MKCETLTEKRVVGVCLVQATLMLGTCTYNVSYLLPMQDSGPRLLGWGGGGGCLLCIGRFLGTLQCVCDNILLTLLVSLFRLPVRTS